MHVSTPKTKSVVTLSMLKGSISPLVVDLCFETAIGQ